MQVDQSGHGDPRCPDLHACADGGVQHPRRESNNDAGGYFNVNELAAGALLAVLWSESTPVQRVPAIVNLDFLPDMGRMTG
jgi:hypothetical protein